MARWDEDCKQAGIRSGYATLERESDAASDRLWELVRPRTAARLDAAFHERLLDGRELHSRVRGGDGLDGAR
jgi:hypothetical protein